MALRVGNHPLGKVKVNGKRIGKIYVGSLLVYSIDMFKALMMQRLYHTPIDGDDIKKSGQIKLHKIEGNGEIVNQLVTKPIDSGTVAGLTITNNNDGSVTISGTPTAYAIGLIAQGDYTPCHVGDKLLIFGGNKICPLRSAYQLTEIDSGNGVIITAQAEREPELALQLSTLSAISNAQTIFPQCVNLTQEFGTGNEPTSLSDNRIKRIIAKGYIPKNSGTYQGLIVQRFEDRGFNCWDEQWKVFGSGIRAADNFPVLPNTTYYFRAEANQTVEFYFRDIDGNNIGNSVFAQTNQPFTIPDGCRLLLFTLPNYGSTVYNHDICISISCSRNGQYVPARWQDFYEEVEYIESTGTQWIDTGFTPNRQTSIDVDVTVTSVANSSWFAFGAGTAYNSLAYECYPWNSTDTYQHVTFNIGSYTSLALSACPFNEKITLYIKQNSVGYIAESNSDTTTYSANDFTSLTSLWLFAIHRNGGAQCGTTPLKMFSCQIYDNNTLVRDFIPVYRKSDKKPGLYDRANNAFYTNNGTGEFVLGPNKMLPEEYREVEYLESTGTQYVDTGFIANQDTSIKLDMQLASSSMAYYGIYGTINANNTQRFELYIDPNNMYEFGYGDAYRTQYRISTDRTTIEQNKNIATVNGQSYSITSTQTFTASNSFYIFNMNRPTMLAGSQMKLYSCKLYDNNTLVRSFVPCYRITDRKPGLYDKVNGKFYVNSGTGEFIVGPDTELPAGYQELEYIESTGTQYVDSGVSVKSKISVNAKFIYTELTGENTIIGAGNDTDTRCYLITTNTSNQFRLGYGTQLTNSSTTAVANVLYECEVDTKNATQTMKVNGSQIVSTNYSSTFTAPITLPILAFRYGVDLTYYAKAKLYSLKIYDNTTLVRSFIPARRLADNEIGLFDKVNDKFYSNKGSGFFIAGPEVNVRTSFMLPQPIKLDGAMKAHDTFEVTEEGYRFTRNVWKEDIATASWQYDTDYKIFYTYIANKYVGHRLNITSALYTTVDKSYREMLNMEISGTNTDTGINVKNDSYPTIEQFKAAMSGVPLYYQLATPQIINISKKHLGYVKLKDLSGWISSSSPHCFYINANALGYKHIQNVPMFTSNYIYDGTKSGSPYYGDNMHITAYYAQSQADLHELYIHNDSCNTIADLVASFSDTDVLFYETQDEVSDPLLSLPFQKGGELNGQQYEIPVEYQKVEYIESTGTQWIDTGVAASDTLTASIDLRPNLSYMSENAIFGAEWNQNGWFLMFYSNHVRFHDNNYVANSTDITTTDLLHIQCNQDNTAHSILNVNGTTYIGSLIGAYAPSTNNIYLFITQNKLANTSQYGRYKLYNYKCYDNAVLIQDLVPCYRKSDGVIGLYDKVTNQFFTNQGTGTFLKGHDVDQIIDCEVLPNVEVDAQKI